MALIAAGIFGIELWKGRDKKAAATEGPVFDMQVIPVLAIVVVWTAAYYFVFNELGFVISTSIFLFPLMAYFNRGKWIANVVSAVGFSVLIYVLFVKLDVNLPSGILQF